jgi:hypothetical protein
MGVTQEDTLPLLPLATLAFVYWVRDRYLFNRVGSRWWTATRVQIQILLFVYPLWTFLHWVSGLQARRRSPLAILTTTGSHLTGHLSTVALLNDSFLQTRQQITSMLIGLVISYMWTVYNMTAFSEG